MKTVFMLPSTEDGMEVDPPSKPRRVAPQPQLDDAEELEPKPVNRRDRLAALAQAINTREDDLTRHVVKYA